MVKGFTLVILLAIPFLLARSDETAPEGFVHWPVATLNSMSKTLSVTAAADPHHLAVDRLKDFPNEYLLLAHREADGQPEVHETEVDVIMVQSGSATLLVGGTLVNGETVSPHEKRNGTIQGGFRQKLGAGDVFRIPAGMPHQMLLYGAHEVTYLVLKVKGY
jgi:mannose-6-phosphate isomerase-like protein (cupin superfamily)